MSFQLMTWAGQQKTGSASRKAVLLALANRANHDTGLCRPFYAKIAEETELSERTVKRAVEDLVEAGFITRTRRRRRDGSLSGYDFHFPVADTVSEPEDTEEPRPEDTVASRSEPGSKPLTVESTTDVVLSARATETVFGVWQVERSRPKAKLTPNRRTKIEARLREGFTVEQLCSAIRGVARDPWKDRPLHDDLVVIFRNGEQVEKFLGLAAGTNGGGTLGAARLIQEHLRQKGAPR